MLCSVCRRQLAREDARCRSCGTPRDGQRHLDLVLPDGQRVPLDRPLEIGRAASADLVVDDPAVSRAHARISVDAAGAWLEDAGSSYGTLLDGRRIHERVRLLPGAQIELGDTRLEVGERHDAAAAGRTISVPAGLTLVVAAPGHRRSRRQSQGVRRPRLRSGWSLKQLAAEEGPRRWVLRVGDELVRLFDPEAELVRALDGSRDLADLVALAGERYGDEGPARLAHLLAELADRGMLSGVAGDPARAAGPGRLRRWLMPRERPLAWVPGFIAAVYRRGGWLLFSRAGLGLVAALAVAGLGAFAALIAGRYGTPFVVAQKVGLGAIVFMAGRFLLVICHELAHGLLAESFGRPVSRAGVKVALVFPYVFVDTTDAWFESRRRRMAISLAGPVSDLAVGGAFALACLLAAPGNARDVLFQVAFGGYVAALFNLNPLLERDGYHVLVDLLRTPGLRRRSMRRLGLALAGRGLSDAADPELASNRALLSYGVASLVWSALTVAFGVLISLRYLDQLEALAPKALVWTVLAAFYIVLALPLAAGLLRPLLARRRSDTVHAWQTTAGADGEP